MLTVWNFIKGFFLVFSSSLDLLIDIADVMDIDVYQLGHTYMQLAKSLCINIPSVGKFSDYI